MVSFDQYENNAFSTAYFIDAADDTEQKRIVQHGFTEEINELLTDESGIATKRLLWGTLEDGIEKSAMQEEKLSEVGDILYFMTAAGFYEPYSLKDIARRGLELFKTQRTNVQTFEEFDEQLTGAMPLSVRNGYDPDYMAMQFFNLEPFVDTNGSTIYSREEVEGSLTLHPDGLFAIERLARNYESNMFSYILPDGYIDSAGLLLCGLSIVAQHRLSGSLAKAAALNIEKRARRAQSNTLHSGVDSERSRPISEPRPTIDGFEGTIYNLLYGIRA